MATTSRRLSRSRKKEPLPPPLPPELRTVGQLVAETIRFYSRRFWPSLALGIGPALIALVGTTSGEGVVVVAGLATIVMTGSYVAACALLAEERPTRQALLNGMAAGLLIYIPVPFLTYLFVVPAVVWLALIGLAVPAAVIERLGLRDAFRRGLQLARADYVHAVGSIFTLTLIVFLVGGVLSLLLYESSDQTKITAAVLSILVCSPLLFLGTALLYFDQAARTGKAA